jgi:2-iminobutanoate/2-iminopropanoate deaminase
MSAVGQKLSSYPARAMRVFHRAGKTLYLSGQIAIDPKTNQLMSNASDQTRRVLDNLTAVLAADGLTMDQVVSTTVFL